MTILGHKIVGSGKEPIVMMHEWLGDHSNYNPTLPYLNQKDFKWIFVDLRGYGLSKNIAGNYTCREAADDLKNLIQHLGFNSVHLVGHSMSAMVAQRIVADTPRLVKNLVLVTPVPASGISLTVEEQKILKKSLTDDSITIAAINARTGNRYNSTWLNVKLLLARKASTIEARSAYLDMFLHTNFSKDVAGIKVPVRIIVGEYDIPVFKYDHIKRIFSQWFPNTTIKKCREAGHYPMLECPIFFASMIEQLITKR